MTDTPHLHALAMRTAAADVIYTHGDSAVVEALGQQVCCTGQHCGCRGATVEDELRRAILALPLEADHADLVREAVKLPEIAALIEAASEQAEYMSLIGDDGDLLRNLVNTLQPFLALETP